MRLAIAVRAGLQEFPGVRDGEALGSTSYRQHLPMCKGCKKKAVYYDQVLGPFKYCSPECRDEDVLPKYNIKLQEFMDACSVTASLLHGRATQHVRHIELKKKAKDELGVFFSKTSALVSGWSLSD